MHVYITYARTFMPICIFILNNSLLSMECIALSLLLLSTLGDCYCSCSGIIALVLNIFYA